MHDMNNDIAKVLISEEQLQAKVVELGAQISRDYEGKDLLLVSILKGSVVFMADLMRAITEPAALTLWWFPAMAVPTPLLRALSRSSRTWIRIFPARMF